MNKMQKSEEELKADLDPELYRVARQKGTEAPFSGELTYNKDKGTFMCAVCGNPLFSSETKFDSGTGWPSFTETLPGAVEYEEDNSSGTKRTEVKCAKCGSHLGHVFDDGPKGLNGKPSTGKRYCMNSVCLLMEKDQK
jgi:peptide-methionine (R)-S-oxide reductase